MAGHADHARVRLAERIVAGQAAERAALAKAADRGVDESRVVRLQIVVTKTARLGAAGLERMHEDVGGGGEAAHDLHTGGVVEIDAHAFFGAGVRKKRARVARLGPTAVPCGSVTARVVTGSGALDLDDSGAEVAEEL